jgi:hypothetical protein
MRSTISLLSVHFAAVFAAPAQATASILEAAPDKSLFRPSGYAWPYSSSWSEVGAGADGRTTFAIQAVPTTTYTGSDRPPNVLPGTFTGAPPSRLGGAGLAR